MDDEVWLPVVGQEGRYEVSSHGRVRSLTRMVKMPKGLTRLLLGRVMKPGPSSNGYLTVNIQGRSVPVQWLVAAAHIGPRPDGLWVLHDNGNRTQNHVGNLKYGTPKENADDAARHGTKVRGEGYSSAKLSDLAASAIRALKGVFPQSDLARLFDVSPAAVQAVHDGRTWMHVTPMSKDYALVWLWEEGPGLGWRRI